MHFTQQHQERARVDSQLLEWSKAVSPVSPSTYTHHEDGSVRTVTQAFWVVHMFNHQTHHLGPSHHTADSTAP
ncbi:MAG: hypothetical protein H7Z15_07685 [Rhizobacter sp.]|nr:hypothetical protein [Rhizobacter sp.]